MSGVALLRVVSTSLVALPLMVSCSSKPGPAREEPPAQGSWTVSMDGAGSVRLGMTRSELTSRGGAINSESEACEYVIPDGAPPGIRAMVVHGVVRRIDVAPPGVATAQGIGIGSSEAEVKAAYPNLVVQPHKYTSGHYLVAELNPSGLGSRSLVFETDGSRVTRYRVGLVPEVVWVEGCG